MRKTVIVSITTALVLMAGIPGFTQISEPQDLPKVSSRAGVAVVDSTWHVGASAGQYASDGTSVGSHGVDPYTHSARRESSYGIQGRESVRALVVEGTRGKRLAIISNDLYIPQDLLNRRVEILLQEHDAHVAPNLRTGIDAANMTISVSHSHSSPYYSTPSWGVWAFQDVFDFRFFEHLASRMAEAVIQASGSMVPVRMGAAVSTFTKLKKHSYGPANSYDGLPAGYPRTDVDGDLSVVRFDDMTDAAKPTPLAQWVIWGMHPENLDGNDLLTGEYVNTMYRIIDRELGGVTLFSQADTGTAEADESEAHLPVERQEFSHKEYAQMERAARELADAVGKTYRDIARVSSNDVPEVATNVQRFSSAFPVAMKDLRLAPPGARVFPTVSSCRTEKAFDGNPGVPIVGLPDCEFIFGNGGRAPLPFDPGVTYDALRQAGVPVPDNTGAPSYTGLQETLQVHLQAIRLGNIGITVCPCEQWADQSRNIKSRLNLAEGDLWFGWDWTANYTSSEWEPGIIYDGQSLAGHGPLTLNDWCRPVPAASWTCKNPRNPNVDLAPVSHDAFIRMKAQIYNNAAGWDQALNSLKAESDPYDSSEIWGNFTHEELDEFGYPMVITVGMSNDYWGYIASYREYQRGDHYRKALTGLGPHSMDFLATRLSRMAAELNGGPAVELNPKDLAYSWDYSHEGARAKAIGDLADRYLPLYEALLPADAGQPQIVIQPTDIQRFQIARMRWVGGSNFIDTPRVRVERCIRRTPCDPTNPGKWVDYADGSGEVEVKANFPQQEDTPSWATGDFTWQWDVTFEAFDSDITLPDAQGIGRRQTPAGTYRFVVEGCKRNATPSALLAPTACRSYDPTGRVTPYTLTSQPFQVDAWEGITISDLNVSDGVASFHVGPRFPWAISASNTERGPIDYPNSYASPFRFIRPRNLNPAARNDDRDLRSYPGGIFEVFCFHCSFRPWADTGSIVSAHVTIVRASGKTKRADATCDDSGTCSAPVDLRPGDSVRVDRGAVVDEFGEFNA